MGGGDRKQTSPPGVGMLANMQVLGSPGVTPSAGSSQASGETILDQGPYPAC